MREKGREMVTDEERREIARKLRALADGESPMTECSVDALYIALGLPCSGTGIECAVIGYLAELIDRPTCHDDDEREQYPVYTDWLFKCSYCGWDGQIWKSVGFGDMSSCVTNYCPNCGEAAL